MKTPVELFGVECGKGWHPLIEPIFQYIDEHNSTRTESSHIKVIQVKEKWGFLHIYTDGTTDELSRLIRQAEDMSKTTCEECGKPGCLKKVNGWWRTLCDGCLSEELT